MVSGRASGRVSGDEGIHDADAFEAGEVAVGGPELADAMEAADGIDSGIVSGTTGDAAGVDDALQFLPVAGRFADQMNRRRLEPGLEGVNGCGDGSRRVENPGVSGDRQKI